MKALAIPLILLTCWNFTPHAMASSTTVEEVLAVVGNAPLLHSDLELAAMVHLVERLPAESDADFWSRLLDARIQLELQFRDLEASGTLSRLDMDYATALESLASRGGGREDLERQMAAAGLSWADLEELSLRLAATTAYVEQRLRPRVAVSLAEVEAYYRTELASELEAAGEPLPELAEVSDQIHRLLVERKLNSEIEQWIEEADEGQALTRYVR